MLIILDRDGVINYDSSDYIKSPEEWRAIPGSLEAIAKLNQSGHKVVIASNQAGIARGYYDLKTLKEIHEKMHTELKKVYGHVDAIFFCPHHPDDNCNCRKPKPGLFLQIQKKYPNDFSNAVMIGDSLRDVEAARAANCKVVLVRTGNGAATLTKNPKLNVPVFADLATVVEHLNSI